MPGDKIYLYPKLPLVNKLAREYMNCIFELTQCKIDDNIDSIEFIQLNDDDKIFEITITFKLLESKINKF